MTTVADQAGQWRETRGTIAQSRGKSARELLPDYLMQALCRNFTARRVEYIAHILSAEELRVIADVRDALIIARIKRMPAERLKHFDQYVPRDKEQHRIYSITQLTWLRDEEYLLEKRLGRKPTASELMVDFTRNQNGIRFRAYYAMKYPARMCRRDVLRSNAA